MRKITRRSALRGTAGLLGAVALPAYAGAQSSPIELNVQYSIPVLFKELMETIGQTFMANNSGIKLNFRAPKNGYEEIMQRNLRDAVTNSLPDVAFHGLNRQRTLLERNIPIDLAPLLERDPQVKELGFFPALLSLGQVGNKQTGIGFALSTPILTTTSPW